MEELNQVLEPKQILGVNITPEQIKARIVELSNVTGEDLKRAMTELKIALKANPEACNLLLPEEIGAMVKKIYEMTNTKVVEVKAKDTTRAAKKIDVTKLTEMPADF